MRFYEHGEINDLMAVLYIRATRRMKLGGPFSPSGLPSSTFLHSRSAHQSATSKVDTRKRITRYLPLQKILFLILNCETTVCETLKLHLLIH